MIGRHQRKRDRFLIRDQRLLVDRMAKGRTMLRFPLTREQFAAIPLPGLLRR